MKAELDRAGSIRRTLVVAAALAVMLYFARSGATTLTVQVLFTAFIAAATIWLRGQYADSLDGRQWVIPRWFGGLLLAVAAALVVLYYAFDQGSFGVIGVLLAYFVAGSAIAQIRQSESVHLLRLRGRRYGEIHPMRWGLGLTVAGVVLAFGGAALLGPAEQVVLGPLLVVFALLVLLPVGLAIWSEQVLRRLCRKDEARAWLWGLGGTGAVVFVAVTAAFSLWNSTWLIAVMVVLGLLVVALVSTTQADIVAVMAVVALMGVTPLQASEHRRLKPGDTRVLVALGDSYLSGEGASIYYQGTDDGGGNQCRRAPTAWAAMAAQDETNFDGLAFLACSGARTANVLTEHPASTAAGWAPARVGVPAPSPQRGETYTQLDAYRRLRGTFKPRIVVLSIGGNDAGFSTIGVMCVAPGNCDSQAGLWENSLDQVRKQLRATYLEVDAAFPGVPVVVVPYPDPISIRENGCPQVALSRAEQRFVHRFLTGGLNRVIRQTAEEYGFHYLEGMQDALARAHLQLCDPLNDGRPGINFIGLRSVRGIAEQRFNPANWTHSSLHPNERGHAAMLRVFQTWWAIEKASITPRRTVGVPAQDRSADALNDQRRTTREQAQATATRRAPQCSLFDNTKKGCRPQGQQWAYQRVGWTLLIYGAGALLAAAGAWCVAVALFARSRRHWARRQSPPDPDHRALL